MAIWFIFALMTSAAVMAVLWPLSCRAEGVRERDQDAAFYRDQIAEIERDEARGLLSATEAEAARTEAGRRLLRSAALSGRATDPVGEPALRRRRAASALTLSAVPLLALATYGALGSPQLPAQPFSMRQSAREDPRAANPEGFDTATAIARIEAHLAQHPEDGRGWEVVAPVYLRSNQPDNAVKAYAAAVRLLGETAPRLSGYGEALVVAGDGVVSSEARDLFEKALRLEPAAPKARYYLALAAEQDGKDPEARAQYQAILDAGPPDAPWIPLVSARVAALGGDTGAAAAALSPGDRQGTVNDAIKGMVEGLAARLEARGGTAEEWRRLIRSYTVTGEREKAQGSLAKARLALAGDPAGLKVVDDLAREAGLRPGATRPEPAQPGPAQPGPAQPGPAQP